MIATCWALCNLVLFGLTLLSVSQRPHPRTEERFTINRPGTLTSNGQKQNCTVINLSLTGVLLGGTENVEVGESVRLYLDDVGDILGKVVRKPDDRIAIHFAGNPEAVQDKLVRYLYTSGLSNEVNAMNPFVVVWRLLKGAILGPT